MSLPLACAKKGDVFAISLIPSFNFTNAKRTRVGAFPLIQFLCNAVDTSVNTNFNSKPAYLLDQTTQPLCFGDAPGWAGGVKSGTVSAKVKPISGASKFYVNNKKVVCAGDFCTMNNENTIGMYVAIE